MKENRKNMNAIKNTGIDYYWQEALTWNRTMDFYLQENAFFKTRLADALENDINIDLLEMAEYFQSCFVQKDEGMKDLRNDIDKLQRLIRVTKEGKNINEAEVSEKFKKLNNEITHFTKGFETLKSGFNQYLISILHPK
jgi:hypothetical protein